MELIHYGIMGQKWGVRNGPPYPLKGGDYSPSEKYHANKRHKKGSLYNKKHFDITIDKDKTLSTLSYDKDRTDKGEMFYASFEPLDKHQYNVLFNKKIKQPVVDEDGSEIGSGMFYKYRISNTLSKDVKVASEDSGIEAFLNLYKNNRDFKNFVTDSNRMMSYFVKDKYKFKGYREARNAFQIMDKDKPSEDQLRKLYRIFNYTIPYDGSGNERNGKDMQKQRAKFFNELKKNGYSAVLDTNDAIYGGFKAKAPVIVFDHGALNETTYKRVKTTDKVFSEFVFFGKKFLSLGG